MITLSKISKNTFHKKPLKGKGNSALYMNKTEILKFSLGPLGAAFFGAITLPVMAWMYSPEDIGRLSLIQVIINFSLMIFCLGLDQAYIRHFHESMSKAALFKACTIPSLIIFIIACVISLYLFRPSFYILEKNNNVLDMFIYSCLLLTLINRFISLILRMQERGFEFSINQISQKFIFLVFVVCSASITSNPGIHHIALSFTLSIFATTLICSWNVRRDIKEIYYARIDNKTLMDSMKFGAPLILGGAAYWGLTTSDKIIIKEYSNLSELGVYSLAANFAAIGVIFQSVFSTVWAPTVYKWAAEGAGNDKIDDITQHALFITMCLTSLCGLFSWIVVLVLPSNYSQIQYLVVSCLAYPLLYTLSETTVVGIGITKKSLYSMLASLGAFAVNLIACFLLVPAFGAAGASASIALSFWFFLLLRTEFSSFLWRPLKRVKLYTFTAISTGMSIAFTLFGEEAKYAFYIAWALLLIACIFSFKTQRKIMINFALKKTNDSKV